MTAPVIRDYLKIVAGGTAGAADADLVARFAASRDEAAFELLVWRHAALVQRVCRSVLRDHHAAEDASQAAFLVLARKAHSFAGHGSVVGWLYRVARRVSIKLARQRARLPVGMAHLNRVPAPVSDDPSDADAVWAEVARLPERYRIPVLLCFFEGLTHADAARRTGWPVGTVSSRLGRAKDLLARRLSRRGLGVPAVALPLACGSFVSQTAQAATAFVAGGPAARLIPPTVLSLAQGVMMSSTLVKLSAAAAVMCAVTGGVWGFSPAPAAHSSFVGSQLPAAAGVPDATPDDLKPAVAGANAAQRMQSVNNLKQIMLAVHNYHDVHQALPRDVTDNGGKPLLSWRVLLLPYLEQDALYRQFKLSEPWDSANNKALLARMPAIFRTPADAKGLTKTYYQGFAGPGTVFEPGEKVTFAGITDGTSNTVGVIEAGPSVEWTRPGGIAYDPKKPFPKLVGPYSNVRVVGVMDGSVVGFKPDVKADLFRRLVERADGNPVDFGEATLSLKPTARKNQELAERMRAENDELAVPVARLEAERQKLLGGAAGKPVL
ncbi:MAG TPA: sigma-70 family RNA polymerase sigma factor, partial [Gemmataceae bacterium]|nr:sigma-70 family RNA polymerase sigma factor [Gemmataceae bacterium]